MSNKALSPGNEIPGAAPVEKPAQPVSEARLRANRLNAQKSTGPRTEEGKQRSRLNATRHGFTGQVLCLPPEELDALNAIIRQFEQHYQPAGSQEQHFVHMLPNFNTGCTASWPARTICSRSAPPKTPMFGT
jgi:hypothetical protein